jgi:hypothetical protein
VERLSGVRNLLAQEGFFSSYHAKQNLASKKGGRKIMTIDKAVRMAMRTGCRIKRLDDISGCEFEPTNTGDCIIIYGPGGMKPCVRWNPTADDLISECWVVMLDTVDGERRPYAG